VTRTDRLRTALIAAGLGVERSGDHRLVGRERLSTDGRREDDYLVTVTLSRPRGY